MSETPEEAQARAVRALREAKKERDRVVKKHDARVRTAALECDNAGVARTRIKELAGVSSKTLYAWLQGVGASIRDKRPAAPRRTPGDDE